MSPEIIEGLLAGLAVVGSWLGARVGGKKAEEQLKPINGSTETLRSEVHTISLGMVDLHRKFDGLDERLDTHIKLAERSM